jgi:hypothetical protein
MTSFSLGIAGVIVDGADLGSVTNASMDTQLEMMPTHPNLVGRAQIVGSKQILKSAAGSISITTEEIGTISSLITKMTSVFLGEVPKTSAFKCNFPGSGGSVSGEVILLPQLTFNVSPEGWSSATIQLQITGLPIASAGDSAGTTTVGGVPFIGSLKPGALTLDTKNLCSHVTCGGSVVGSLSLSFSCQSVPIYRDNSPWPVDYVIDTGKVSADIGFYDFAELSAIYEESAAVEVIFHLIGGEVVPINLGLKCMKVLSGLRTTNGLNTWHVKVEGSAA